MLFCAWPGRRLDGNFEGESGITEWHNMTSTAEVCLNAMCCFEDGVTDICRAARKQTSACCSGCSQSKIEIVTV